MALLGGNTLEGWGATLWYIIESNTFIWCYVPIERLHRSRDQEWKWEWSHLPSIPITLWGDWRVTRGGGAAGGCCTSYHITLGSAGLETSILKDGTLSLWNIARVSLNSIIR